MKTFKQFLTEGGWSNVATQSTKLTPATAKKAVSVLPKFETDFNAFLKTLGLPPIKIGKPVGSSSYIERDIKENPDKEYGDIDVLMIVPRLDGLSESKNNASYTAAVKEFVGTQPKPYLLQDPDNFGNSIIVKIGDEHAQVDLVKTFGDIYEWASARMTPEHGLKGALLGNLFTSFGELLHISLGPSGVLVKEKAGEWVPYKSLKVDKVHTISLDMSRFLLDILKKVHDKIGSEEPLEVHPLLKKNIGMNKELMKASDLANGIKGIGKSFELNEMFGKGPLKNVRDYEDFISKIKAIYIEKNEKGARDTKFLKASTPEAKAKAEATKDLLLNKSKEISALLD